MYRNPDESINLRGVVLLHILFNLHSYPFRHDILSEQLKTGWAEAKGVQEPYKDSVITNEGIIDKNIIGAHIHSPKNEAIITKVGQSLKKRSESDESSKESDEPSLKKS